MIQEKVAQAQSVLKEKNIDAWMIFARESHTMADPAMSLVVGAHCTWDSAFIYTAKGETVAIVGNLDQAAFADLKHFKRVLSFKEGFKDLLRQVMTEINPRQIAINYSKNDYMADGLTHGMYLQLMEIFADTPFATRFISAEEIMAAVRGRKSATEIQRIAAACQLTLQIYDQVTHFARPGLAERDVANFIITKMQQAGVEPAWDIAHCPAVFTGPDTAGAHYGPTGRVIEPGHIMNIDFGVRLNDYVSDLQRTWYFLKPGEKKAPAIVQKAFDTVRDSIQAAADALRPGKQGWEIDKIARDYILARGFAEYPHALGHQVGRSAHDGAGTLCPQWERYKQVPFMKVEAGQVYTLEPRVFVPDYGTVTMEEIVVVRENDCEFLSAPQRELICIG
ncbi:Xaa-Pro peptidase family protein [candidate division KSB1 bacterium]|nr:Xaa-Pro peptidase family protein [candidate division KSB1 bacterium]